MTQLSTKQLTGMLYAMGHTFDNLSSTYIATEEFLRTQNPAVLGSKQDYALLQDLQDAANWTLHYDYTQGISVEFVQQVNAHMTRTAAIEPGVLRTSSNILVHTQFGDYFPPIPQEEQIQALINRYTQNYRAATSEAKNNTQLLLHNASALFAHLAKMQPFGDGNKRTALLAANGLLFMHSNQQQKDQQLSFTLIVPTTDPDRSTFNTLLAAWYMHQDPQIIDWLTDFNLTHQELDDEGRPITVK